MALQMSRPRTVNLVDCTVKAPIDCDIPEHASLTLLRTGSEPDCEPPSHYTSQIVQYEIAVRIHDVLNHGLLNSTISNTMNVMAIHQEVEQLLQDLPPTVSLQNMDRSWDLRYPEIVRERINIRIIAGSFLMALHRPHVAHPQSLVAEVKVAKSVLDFSQVLFEITKEHQYKTFTLIFYTIDSGLFLSAIMAKHAHDDAINGVSGDAPLKTLEDSVNRLNTLKQRNTAWTSCNDG